MQRTIYLAFHEGKFDRIMKVAGYPEIYFVYDGTTYQFEVKSCKKISDNALVSFVTSSPSPMPVGIISWVHPLSKADVHCIVKLKIILATCNKLAVHLHLKTNLLLSFLKNWS